jgi:hypothetical protein
MTKRKVDLNVFINPNNFNDFVTPYVGKSTRFEGLDFINFNTQPKKWQQALRK